MCSMANECPGGAQVCHNIKGIFELIHLLLCAIVNLVKREPKILFEFSPEKKLEREREKENNQHSKM